MNNLAMTYGAQGRRAKKDSLLKEVLKSSRRDNIRIGQPDRYLYEAGERHRRQPAMTEEQEADRGT